MLVISVNSYEAMRSLHPDTWLPFMDSLEVTVFGIPVRVIDGICDDIIFEVPRG